MSYIHEKVVVVQLLEFFPNWTLLPIANSQKYFFKLNPPYLCWDLDPQHLAYEARTIPHKTTKKGESGEC